MENTPDNIILNGFNDIKQIIRKRIWLIILVLGVFIGFVVVKTLMTKKLFVVKFTLDSILLARETVNDSPYSFHKSVLDILVDNFTLNLFQKAIDISIPEEERKIYSSVKKIETTTAQNNKDFPENFRLVNVTYYLFDTVKTSFIINNMVDYINNTPYIKNSYKMEKERLIKMREFYLSELDETRAFIRDLKSNQQNKLIQVNVNSDFIYSQEKMSEIDSKLEYLDKVKVVLGPSCSVIEPNTKQDFILFGILGLLIGISVAIAIEKIHFL